MSDGWFDENDYSDKVVHDALKPPPPWPAGTDYTGTVIASESHQGDGKPYPCVKVLVNVANTEGKTKKLTKFILSKNPSEGNKQYNVRTLAAFGLTPRDFAGPQTLVGLSANVSLDVTEGQDGTPRNEIKSFFRRR